MTQEPQVLMSGLRLCESPRWHGGRLWFADWLSHEIIALDLQGNHEVVAKPSTHPFCIDWLPDGRLVFTNGTEVVRMEPEGSPVTHAELGELAPYNWNEIVVDSRGNAYVNNINFDFTAEQPRPGIIALVTPDGSVRQVADGIAFPNGMVVTPDDSMLIVAESMAGRLTAFDIEADGGLSNRRVWAEGVWPDGICLDAEGAIWTTVGEMNEHRLGRVQEGGEVLGELIQPADPCFACALGGEDGRTLFILTNDWRPGDGFAENMERLANGPRTGRVLTVEAPAPAAARP
jgi:sugar lactone lactonase YvrE